MAVLIRPRTEGTHWYTANGEPVHTRPNKDGQGEHSTNLVDARKLRLFPSVTNVLGILGKPGLEKWKVKQILLAMMRWPKKDDEATEPYFDRVIDEAFKQVDDAQDTGKGMHASMMAALQGRSIDEQYRPYVDKVFAFFDREGIECQTSEQTIVNHEFGFAGTMDFGGMMRDMPLVLDWKTRKTLPGKPIISYEVQPMQVASYGATYWAMRWNEGVLGGNIYISSTEPGRIELIPYSVERMRMEWESFKHCCAIWQAIKGYNPLVAGTAAEVEGSELAKEKYEVIVLSTPDESFSPVKRKPVHHEHAGEPQAMSIAKPLVKKAGKAKKTQDDGKKKTAKPTFTKSKGKGDITLTAPDGRVIKGKISEAPKSRTDKAKPTFGMGVQMPFGPHAGEFIANVPDAYLLKIWKFSRRNLAKHADAFEAVKARVG